MFSLMGWEGCGGNWIRDQDLKTVESFRLGEWWKLNWKAFSTRLLSAPSSLLCYSTVHEIKKSSIFISQMLLLPSTLPPSVPSITLMCSSCSSSLLLLLPLSSVFNSNFHINIWWDERSKNKNWDRISLLFFVLVAELVEQTREVLCVLEW